MIWHKIYVFGVMMAALLFIFGCSEEYIRLNPQEDSTDWLIPRQDVQDGGPGKDGIPSIDNPSFDVASAISFLDDEDIIIAIEYNGEIVGYPHAVLDWHEIVNDQIGGMPLAVTYCPLTGTTIAWNRRINGAETTFGVSGLIYNSNLIPYDRSTDSNWSQILQVGLNGQNKNRQARQYPTVEMTWSAFKEFFSDAKVLNLNTGFNLPYGRYPYDDYRTNNGRLIFPVEKMDARIPQKERVLALRVNRQSTIKIYRFSDLEASGGFITDNVAGEQVIVVGDAVHNYMTAFKVSGRILTYLPNSFPNVLIDDRGNTYDIFGRSTGNSIYEFDNYMGYWFTFPAFFETVELYNN